MISRLIAWKKMPERCREHFAVIDNDIVWYGSMNLLSREIEEDSIMRLENASIAQELLLKCMVTTTDINK